MWSRLVRYHRDAVFLESATTPADYDTMSSRKPSWLTVQADREPLFGEPDGVLEATDAITRLADELSGEEELYYGWPTLVVRSETGRPVVAPLIVCSLERDGDVYRVGELEPRVNLGLVNERHFDPEIIAALDWEAYPVRGDRRSVAIVVRRLVGDLALAGALELDMDHLGLDPPPRSTPTAANCAIVFRGGSSLITAGLLADLGELADKPDVTASAAAVLLSAERAPARTAGRPETLCIALNASQEAALSAARHARVTVVTGPPGTGKSQLVAGLVADAWIHGESVLVASTNNAAVDVATDRANKIAPGLLIRTGNLKVRTGAEERPGLRAQLEELLSSYRHGSAGRPDRGRTRVFAAARADLEGILGRRTATEAALAAALVDYSAFAELLWNSNEQPAAERLPALARGVRGLRFPVLRGWRWRRLKARFGLSPVATREVAASWQQAYERRKRAKRILAELPPRDHGAEAADLARADAALVDASVAILKESIAADVHRGRTFINALIEKAPRIKSRIGPALPYVRGWSCTAMSMRGNFPLMAGLFDLAIVDEASQCSIAHVLPLAYRARRIVVIGDPQQLPPVFTLNEPERARLARLHGMTREDLCRQHLAHGDDSCFSALAARADVRLLAEHYRCHPHIAEFSNRHFYGGQLRVLTDVAAFASRPRGVSFVQVEGRTEPGRPSGRLNRAEAAVVVDEVRRALDVDPSATIGVVTPFAHQAQIIESLLKRSLSAEQREHARLRVGTAHRFQGDERRIMIVSLVLSHGAPAGSAAWVEQERNLINVAVSRAQQLLVIVGDAPRITGFPVPTLHALIRHACGGTHETVTGTPHRVLDAARRSLIDGFDLGDGQTLVSEVNVEGYPFPLSLRSPDGLLVYLDIDAYDDAEDQLARNRQLLDRDSMLTHAKFTVARVPAWQCLEMPAEVLRTAAQAL